MYLSYPVPVEILEQLSQDEERRERGWEVTIQEVIALVSHGQNKKEGEREKKEA